MHRYRVTYHLSGRRKLAPEVETTLLLDVPREHILDRWLSDVSNGEQHSRRGAADLAQILGQREHGPAVGDGAEVVVLDGGEHAVVQELPTDDLIVAYLGLCAFRL